jgi:tetratricopeptide (TPR) repeat protein
MPRDSRENEAQPRRPGWVQKARKRPRHPQNAKKGPVRRSLHLPMKCSYWTGSVAAAHYEQSASSPGQTFHRRSAISEHERRPGAGILCVSGSEQGGARTHPHRKHDRSRFALSNALAAFSFAQRKVFGWSTDAAQEIAEANRLAKRAIELDRDDARVLAITGQALSYVVGEVEEAAALLSRAVTRDPNLAVARSWMGWTLIYLGEVDSAIEQLRFAMRLNPLDPRAYSTATAMAYAHFFADRIEDASYWATTAVSQQPNYLAAQRILMACHAIAGRVREAQLSCALPLQIDPTQRISGEQTGLHIVVSKRLGSWSRPSE